MSWQKESTLHLLGPSDRFWYSWTFPFPESIDTAFFRVVAYEYLLDRLGLLEQEGQYASALDSQVIFAFKLALQLH